VHHTGLQLAIFGRMALAAALGFAIGHSKRDGFTKNDITGHDLDFRNGTFGKAQLLVGAAPSRRLQMGVRITF